MRAPLKPGETGLVMMVPGGLGEKALPNNQKVMCKTVLP